MKVRLCSIVPVTTCRPSLYHVPSILFSWCVSTQGFSIPSSCAYTGSEASISSWATILHIGGVCSILPALTKMRSGNMTTFVMYTPPHDRQTAKCKQKRCAEEWIKSRDSITETMTRPNGVYTRYVSTSPPESEQDDA